MLQLASLTEDADQLELITNGSRNGHPRETAFLQLGLIAGQDIPVGCDDPFFRHIPRGHCQIGRINIREGHARGIRGDNVQLLIGFGLKRDLARFAFCTNQLHGRGDKLLGVFPRLRDINQQQDIPVGPMIQGQRPDSTTIRGNRGRLFDNSRRAIGQFKSEIGPGSFRQRNLQFSCAATFDRQASFQVTQESFLIQSMKRRSSNRDPRGLSRHQDFAAVVGILVFIAQPGRKRRVK